MGLRGPQPRKKPPVQPTQAADLPTCPHWLDKQAKERWEYTTARLAAIGKITQADQAALIRYCVEWSLWLDCMAVVQSGGVVGDDDEERPEVKLSMRLAASLTRFETLFGLNASSRHTLMPQEPPKKAVENPLAKLDQLG